MGGNVFKLDNLKLGFVLGFIAPFISMVSYYFIRFRLYSFAEYLRALRDNKPLLTGLTIPCLVLNIALFTWYINTKRDKTAKGIFAVTIIYALASLFYKFLG